MWQLRELLTSTELELAVFWSAFLPTSPPYFLGLSKLSLFLESHISEIKCHWSLFPAHLTQQNEIDFYPLCLKWQDLSFQRAQESALQDRFCLSGAEALGCFHFLTPVNSASVTMEMLRPPGHSNHGFAYIPGGGTAESYNSSISIYLFWGASKVFSHMALPIYIPTKSMQGLFFLYKAHQCLPF